MNARRILSISLGATLLTLVVGAAEPGGGPDFSAMARSGVLKWIWHKEPGEPATTDTPQLPKAWPSLEVGGIQYRDWILRAKATNDALELDLQADAQARPINIDLGSGRWEVQLLGAEDRVLGEQTVGEGADAFVSIENPASKRLVATRVTP